MKSVSQFGCSVLSDSLQPHGQQHARLPCPSPTPEACSNPCPSSRWCHPIISSSLVPFSSCLQSFSASGSFPMSQFLLGWCLGICIWTNFWGICGNTYVWDSFISWKWNLEGVSCQSTKLPSTSDYFKLNSNSNNYKSDTILGSRAMHACLVTQSYLTLFDPMNYSQPGSSVHGIFFQARILEWVAISSSRGSS